MIHKIVLTGAPASGKTLFFERLQNEYQFADFIFFEELARKLINENQDYRNHWEQFHIDIYSRQVEREYQHAQQSFISDRGTVDAFAFHPQTADIFNSSIENEYQRYSAVILLESSANLGNAFYKTDDVRNESRDETLAIEKKLKNAWSGHSNFHIIKAVDSIEQKYIEFKRIILGIITEK